MKLAGSGTIYQSSTHNVRVVRILESRQWQAAKMLINPMDKACRELTIDTTFDRLAVLAVDCRATVADPGSARSHLIR